jgi:hypothetical protein
MKDPFIAQTYYSNISKYVSASVSTIFQSGTTLQSMLLEVSARLNAHISSRIAILCEDEPVLASN